jgi:ParB/RepB/Spo0J family partition protein
MNTPAPQLSPAKVAAAPVAALLPLDQVNPDPQQPRKAFDEAALNELAASIKAEGLINPIVVKPNGKGYHIVDGERRYRAAKLAGLKEVPSLIRADLKDQDVTALQLVANLQREDLTLPEQCDAIVRLVKTLGTARAAAEKLGKSDGWVSKRVTAAGGRIEVRKLMNDGHIVDPEIANGLNELISISKPGDQDVKHLIDRIKDPGYDAPVTRDELRDAVADEKAAIKRREEQAAEQKKAREKAAKARAGGKPVPPKQPDVKEVRKKKWDALLPLVQKFAKDIKAAVGFDVEGPHVYSWDPPEPPASVATTQLRVWIRNDAEGLQKLASKTGLNLKLEIPRQVSLTPDQARRFEQLVGKKLPWSVYVNAMKGSQLAEIAKKFGKPVDLPQLPAASATTPAAGKAPVKKAKARK